MTFVYVPSKKTSPTDIVLIFFLMKLAKLITITKCKGNLLVNLIHFLSHAL